MFNDTLTMLAIVCLVMFAAGSIAYALLFARVNNEATVAKRIGAISERPAVASERRVAAEQGARRKSIQDSLKEFEAKQKAIAKQVNKPPLTQLLEQAGLHWSKRKFYVVSALIGAASGAAVLFISGKPFVALGFLVMGGLGLPRWLVNFLRKRRISKFLDELPNAVDIIVRGIKSGLPLADCMRIIAAEASEPVKTEFRLINEAQQMGMTIGDAVMKLHERVPAQEASFFGIVISIQAKAGGNLSDALGNLSKVLRDRKKMKAKIVAMSMEAKASASIIGALPIIVTGLVYLTSPNYVLILFTTKMGNVILIGGLLYMFIGILVMRKMISFDI
ncbi:MAG: type II secretion system F family protein [Ancalomicrobiaceae bacterium]|nr:type II secretion system F family protein [Ancalomicrobiaceae bacterium]